MTVMMPNANPQLSTENTELELGKDESLILNQSTFLYHHMVDEPIDLHYTLGELLGEGGFGIVYKGTHKKTGAVRAIKKMEKDPSDPEINQEVIREFGFLKELDHPNLIKVYDMFEDKAEFHIVTDLYGGGDLIDYLEVAQHLSENKVLVFMNKLLTCMEYLHDSRMMCHRDLKLENILLDTDQDLADMKLIDFGLARHFTPEDTFFELCGSTSYVAPQVIEGSYTAKCDIWSCGVIAFCLLGGYTPFDGYDDGETLQYILCGKFEFDDPVWDPISDAGKDFITQLLMYDESDRPSAKEALDHPWLSGYRASELDESTGDLDTSLRESLHGLKRFISKGCKLKQAACAIIASQLMEKEEKETMKADFGFLNRSLSGAITRSDLQQALGDLNMNDSDYEVNAILEQVNFSGSGAISYSEYTIAMMFERDMVDDKKLRLVFKLLDHDGDDAISAYDLHATLQISEESGSKMLAALRCDADGTLSFEQFKHAMLADESMDGSNFLDSSYRMDDVGSRRMADSSIPDTVLEEEEVNAAPAVVEPHPDKLPEEMMRIWEKRPEKLSEDRMRLCFHWYMRFGHPDKQTMLRKMKKMGADCPLTKDDVDRLPWSAGGAIIHINEINKIQQTNVDADGDIIHKRSSIRASAAQNASIAAAAAAVAAEADASESDADDQDEEKEEAPKPTPVIKSTPRIAKPVVTKPAKAEEEPFKPVFRRPSEIRALNRNKSHPYKPTPPVRPSASQKKKLQVSSVLVAGTNNVLKTIMMIEARISKAVNKPAPIVKFRHAAARKELTIFSARKPAPDFDWDSMEKKTLKVISPEERKDPDFDWNIKPAPDADAEPKMSKPSSAAKPHSKPNAKQAKPNSKPAPEAKSNTKPSPKAKWNANESKESNAISTDESVSGESHSNELDGSESSESISSQLDASESHFSELGDLATELDASYMGSSAKQNMDSSAKQNMSASEPGSSQRRSTTMSASEPGSSERKSTRDTGPSGRRSSTVIWTPGPKSAESRKTKFPKNPRRASHAVAPSITPTDKPRSQGKRRVSTRN